MKEVKSKKGFTLIEVILVLAIAALIFLMVLLTLPAVQRAQRDMQRKEDVGKLIAAYTEFLGNNRGTTPRVTSVVEPDGCFGANPGDRDGDRIDEEPSANCDLDPYVELTVGQSYQIVDSLDSSMTKANPFVQTNTMPYATLDNIVIFKRGRCASNGDVFYGDSNRQIATVVRLEGGGANGADVYYCQDN
jgi:prepilin-type N-terminal cleavage/methylation domain-containing protein